MEKRRWSQQVCWRSLLTLALEPPQALLAAEAEHAGEERESREGASQGIGETNHLLVREFTGILDFLG